MKMRLLLNIFLLGVGLIVDVNSQKFTQNDNYKKSIVYRPNDIDSYNIYQQINMKKQLNNYWNNSPDKIEVTDKSLESEENELLKVLLNNSVKIDYNKLDLIGDQMISHANVSEETKRVARQVKKKRPGFFWTIFRVAFETINETRSAIEQINGILEANILPDTTTVKLPLKELTKITTTPIVNSETTTPSTTTTTTKTRYVLTRNALQNILRRNLQGLVRLFNIEWRDAIKESQISIGEFQNNLGKSAQPFLADNPAVY